MIATLCKFNVDPADAGFDIKALTREFYNSGIPVLDSLWARPHASHRERMSCAGNVARSARRMDKDQRANLVYHLVIRFPFALACLDRTETRNESLLISQCVASLVYAIEFGDDNFIPSLMKRLEDIIDAISWHRRNTTIRDNDISPFLTLATFLLHEDSFLHVPVDGIEAVKALYELLDASLDPVNFDESGWFELYKYCQAAVRLSNENSRVSALRQDMPRLLEAYRILLTQASGEKIAAALFSADRDAIWNAAKEGLAVEGAAALFKFLGAWSLRPSTAGILGNEDPLSRLQIALDSHRNWREMYDILGWFCEQPLQLTDSQMASLVISMAEPAGFPSPILVRKAFVACRNGSHPETFDALKGMAAAKKTASPMAYVEMLRWLKVRLFILDVFRTLSAASGRGAARN